MRVRNCCLCTAVVGLLAAATAYGQVRVFMAADGQQNSQPPLGTNTQVQMAPGSMQTIMSWLVDNFQDRGLQSYQMVIRDEGAPQGGATGTVTYVAGSRLIMNRPDFVFNPPPGGCTVDPPTYADFPVQNGFAAIQTMSPLSCEVFPAAGAAKYMMQFQFVASADACGEFEVAYAPIGDPAGGGTFFLAGGGVNQYCDMVANGCMLTLESLTILVGGNDDCADAQVVGNGTHPVVDACATLDGTECAVSSDVWFEYTASCTGELQVNAAGFQVGIYADQACPPSGALACGAGAATTAANTGDTFLIQVGDGPGDNSGDVSIACVSACTPGLPANSMQTVMECCGAAPANDGQCNGSGGLDQCTSVVCDANLGCVYSPRPAGTTCNDGLVCTVDDRCDGGAGSSSCTDTDPLDCNDFDTCSLDVCNEPTGCENIDLNGAACAVDADCMVGGNANATCNPMTLTCECLSGNNLNPGGSLCLDVRNCEDSIAQGSCTAEDADCGPAPDGVLQCSDNDDNPLNGGVCVDQCCLESGGTVTVDLELGSTTEPACGAQYYLQYDADALDLKSVELDPDGELGWSFVLMNNVNEAAGTIDIAMTLPVGVACNNANGTFGGGTIARLTFNADTACKTPGVSFRPHNPPTRVSGPKGAIDIACCNSGDSFPNNKGPIDCGTDEIRITTPPQWDCPVVDAGPADCGTNKRTVVYPAISLSDACDDDLPAIEDLCTIEYFAHCKDDFDCGGFNGTCVTDADCGGNPCVPHPDGTPINVCLVGDCNEATGLCVDSVQPAGVDVADFLDCSGGCDFLPGLVNINCSYTNSCGYTGDCTVSVENSGLNKLIVDVELSPTMVPGNPANPIIRCIDFELSVCDSPTGSETQLISQEVVIGRPDNIPGHGTACLKIQPGNWTCLTARDPKHSLTATCTIECDPLEGVFYAQFKGSQNTNATCHWLVQGNLDGDDHIDIADYTILAGQYLQDLGANTECKDPENPPPGNNFHADLNGDGLVTLGDFTFVVFNFNKVSKDPCEVLCDPTAQAPVYNPRSSLTVRELIARGLGEYVEAADVNADGVVDVADMNAFIDDYGDTDPHSELKNPLKGALIQLAPAPATKIGLRK